MLVEQEEEEKFDFDSNILDTSDGAMVFFSWCKKRPLGNTAENTLFMETFTWKGSSFQEHFQHGLKMCNKVLIQKGTDNKAHSRANKSAPKFIFHTFCISFRENKQSSALKVKQ